MPHETGGTICYGHWLLYLVISHTRQGVRFVWALASASRDISYEIGGTICYGHWFLQGYDLLRALASASCDISHETGGTICYGHWLLHLVICHTRQGVGFVAGTGFCICDISYETGVRCVTGIGFCVL